MALCHGNGDLVRDGCCYVNGQVCPLRWKIEGGHIYDHQGADLGTVEAYVRSVVKGKANQDRVLAQVAGIRFACKAAVDVIANDAKLLSDRPGFEAAWNSHPDYVAQVRPHWRDIELRLDMAEGSYQCSSWRGTAESQCCFAEDQVANDEKSAGLSDEAKALRQAGGTA